MIRYRPLHEAAPETKLSLLRSKVDRLLASGFKFLDGYIRMGNETFLMLNNTLTKVETITSFDIPVFGSLENIIDGSKEKQNMLEHYVPLFEKDMRPLIVDKMGFPQQIADALHELSDKYSIVLANLLKNHISENSNLFGEEGDPLVREWTKKGYEALSSDQKRMFQGVVRADYYNMRPYLTEILDWLKGRGQTPNPEEPTNIDVKNLTFDQALNYQTAWHSSLKALQQVNTKVEEERKRAIMVFPDGSYWLDLETNNSREESERMGHCGADREADTIISYRDSKGQSHLTMSYDYGKDETARWKGGVFRQLKGKQNSKPKAEYHPEIIALFEKLEVYKKLNNGYKPEIDFHFKDLDPEKYADYLAKREERMSKAENLKDYLIDNGVDEDNAEVLSLVLEEEKIEIDLASRPDVSQVDSWTVILGDETYHFERESDFENNMDERIHSNEIETMHSEGRYENVLKYINKKDDEEDPVIPKIMDAYFNYIGDNAELKDAKYEDALVEYAVRNKVINKKDLVKSFSSGKLAPPFNLVKYLVEWAIEKDFDIGDMPHIPWGKDKRREGFFTDMEEIAGEADIKIDLYDVVEESIKGMDFDEKIEWSGESDRYVGRANRLVVSREY